MTTEGESIAGEGSDWRMFMRKHWNAASVFVMAFVLILAGAVYVFWWFVGYAQSTGLVPASLSLWTMGNLVAFILNSIFWELLLIGIPVMVGVVIGWRWWRNLPYEERSGYRIFRKGSRRTRGSGGVSLLFFIAFVIKVFIDGNWSVPIASFTVNYVVGSMITILVWFAVVFGIPGAIAATWWIRREMKKPETPT